MKKNEMKRGELTTQQIVGLVILITSFIVVLFLIFRLNINEESTTELCRNSVALRGKALLKDSVQLNCYRSYKCITQDGTCEGLNNPEVKKVNDLNGIYKEVANEMADCWFMFGEGKVDYIGSGIVQSNYCSICSQIFFDDSLKNVQGAENGEISKDELYNFMSATKIGDGKMTYSEYLFGTNNIQQLKQTVSSSENGASTFGDIEIGKQFFVVMGITSGVGLPEWTGIGTGAGAAIAGVVAATTPIGWIGIGAIAITTAITTGTVGHTFSSGIEPEITAIVLKGNGIDNKFMRPTIVEADSQRFKALNCEEIVTYS